jgi:hypothetical protein
MGTIWLLILIHNHVQIPTRNRHIRMARCGADFSQRPPACQRVADECVPAVVDRQRPESGQAEHFARRQEPSPDRRPLNRPASPVEPQHEPVDDAVLVLQ